MPQDTKLPPDPGVEAARQAAPSPGRVAPQPPGGALTQSDAEGERAREEHPPEHAGTVTPAPPRIAGPDVNDTDSLEPTTGPVLGEPPRDPIP